MLFGGKLVQFKGYSPSNGKVEKLLRHNGRRNHSVTSYLETNMASKIDKFSNLFIFSFRFQHCPCTTMFIALSLLYLFPINGKLNFRIFQTFQLQTFNYPCHYDHCDCYLMLKYKKKNILRQNTCSDHSKSCSHHRA